MVSRFRMIRGYEFEHGEYVRAADYAALAAELANTTNHLDQWYRTEAAIHAQLCRQFGSEAVLHAIGEAADLSKHNPISARIAHLDAALAEARDWIGGDTEALENVRCLAIHRKPERNHEVVG